MKLGVTAAVFGMVFGTAAAALPVTFAFGGSDNFFNEGLVGSGAWSGLITIDPEAASANNLSYPGAITNITLNLSGYSFVSTNECTNIECNSFSPVTLGGGNDAFIANYEGDFTSTTPMGAQALTVSEVLIDIRTPVELFSSNAAPFDLLPPGQTVSLAGDSTFFQMSVRYEESTTALGTSIYNSADLLGLTATAGVASTVPLPAGLPLLVAALGAFAWMRRRHR